jgi:hypothetical protein
VLIDHEQVLQVLDVRVDTQRDADLLRELGLDPDSRAQGGGIALR